MGWLRQLDLITRLCRESHSLLVSRNGDFYWVRPPCSKRGKDVLVGHAANDRSVMFQCYLDVDFPLEREPPGLFARLMLRSFSLHYGSWRMTIGGSCAAQVFVGVRIPTAALDASLFSSVCREVLTEVEAFDQELRDKFRYSVGGAGTAAVDARHVEPMPDGLPSPEAAWRLLHGEGGPARCRLPGRGE